MSAKYLIIKWKVLIKTAKCNHEVYFEGNLHNIAILWHVWFGEMFLEMLEFWNISCTVYMFLFSIAKFLVLSNDLPYATESLLALIKRTVDVNCIMVDLLVYKTEQLLLVRSSLT